MTTKRFQFPRWLFLCLIVLSAAPGAAQDTIASGALAASVTVSAYREAVVFAGPGISHRVVGRLASGIEVALAARTAAGNWVRVIQTNERGNVLLEGWVITGYLNLPDDLRLSAIPAERPPDGDGTTGNRADIAELNAAPLVSPLVGPRLEQVRAIFAAGQAAGNRANVVTKIGDSLSADRLYLENFAQPPALGPYDHLAQTAAFYQGGVGASVAARVGMTSLVVFDPMWNDPAQCQPSESPLTCELRVRQPSVAFIMFGSNDVVRMTDAIYADQLRAIVTETMAAGVIPVISTFSYHPDNDLWPQSVNFNRRAVALADELHLPLINLWAAAQALPEYGLDQDHIHLLHDGFEPLTLGGGGEAYYGATLRNLLTLAMLAEIRAAVA